MSGHWATRVESPCVQRKGERERRTERGGCWGGRQREGGRRRKREREREREPVAVRETKRKRGARGTDFLCLSFFPSPSRSLAPSTATLHDECSVEERCAVARAQAGATAARPFSRERQTASQRAGQRQGQEQGQRQGQRPPLVYASHTQALRSKLEHLSTARVTIPMSPRGPSDSSPRVVGKRGSGGLRGIGGGVDGKTGSKAKAGALSQVRP